MFKDHVVVPKDMTLCIRCWSALDSYLYRAMPNWYMDGLGDQDEQAIASLHPEAMKWINDETKRPLPKKRFAKSVPMWMRSAVNQGMVKTNGKELYVVHSQGALSIKAEIVKRGPDGDYVVAPYRLRPGQHEN